MSVKRRLNSIMSDDAQNFEANKCRVKAKEALVTEYPASLNPRQPSTKADTSRWQCPLSKETLVDPILLGDGQVYNRLPVLDWIKRHPWTDRGPTGLPLITKAFGDDSVVLNLIEKKISFPARCPHLGTPFCLPVQLMPKTSEWGHCGPGRSMELSVWIHLINNTWRQHVPTFLGNCNPFDKDLNVGHCLVPNKLLCPSFSLESLSKAKLVLPVRGEPPQHVDDGSLVEVKSYAELPSVDHYERGRAIVRNVSATRWGIVSDTYFKGHIFVNCRFEECTFHCRIFHNYFVACHFVNCTFLDCEAPPADGCRLFFNCTYHKCKVVHTTTEPVTTNRFSPTAFATVLIGRQTDPAKHLHNTKNINTVLTNQNSNSP